MQTLRLHLSHYAARVRAYLKWAREHKVQVTAVAVALAGVAERLIPGFPVDAVLRALASVLGA